VRRWLYEEEHSQFRESFEGFLRTDVTPDYADWERAAG
jgi:hypothetical protein